MQSLIRALLPLAFAGALLAQTAGMTLPYDGKNQKASVTQFIGPVRISIDYSSPAVHGPDGKDRRGHIWGELVPYGLSNLGFGNGKPGPWRAGANENTVFAVSDEVKIEGQTLPAGRYGLHMIAGKDDWTVIFSKDSEAWGSFFYDPTHDALRVTAKPHKHDYREWLTYEFTVRRPTETTAELQWEDLALPLNIKVENINDLYISHLTHELTTVPGFSYQGYLAAAQFCLTENTHLEQGLTWSDASISVPFIGQANFQTLSTKAQLLSKLNRQQESDGIMKTAIANPSATPIEIHVYGRQLLAAKKNAEALEVFKLNATRNGDAWPVHAGLARGYAANGDKQQALEHAKKALAQAPDDANRKALEAMVKKLADGESID